MSGLLMGIRLQKAGLPFRIIEKSDSVGGTWRENRYPGLTCDVPSFFYSYSFEPNLDWSHRFSPGPEIRAYFESVAKKYDLPASISFNETVETARFEDGRWTIETASGESIRADVLVDATGPLHIKQYPEIPGLESFQGVSFHSADWNDEVDLEGRRVGVIGNGSTGVQMMAPLSEEASRLTLFQRTPQWIFPVGNKRYSDNERKWTRRMPILASVTRLIYKTLFDKSSVGVTEDGYWRRRMQKGCRDYLDTVKDSALKAKLTPDYEPGCKRLILSTSFYPTLNKPNVDLVTETIKRIVPEGVETQDGVVHKLDVLVLATGFQPHEWGIKNVHGLEGLSLRQSWENGPRTYRSISMPGFPNYFMVVGPNSPIGNISIIDVSETQTRYILDCVKGLGRREQVALSPRVEAAEAFQSELREAMKSTIWVSGCNSWYIDPEGSPTLWPWSAKRFHQVLRRPDFSDYDWVKLG
jgi:cation diffusion facilitator CzcD-associated flavoprotein CzcO